MSQSWGDSWGASWGGAWGWQPPRTATGFSSMGRKRKEREERLARLRKDDEMVLAFVRQFVETMHAPS